MIYVHVPYCRSFCTYCDFYSERTGPGRSYVDGVCAEALRRKDEIAAASAVDTLYFGGGTPSVLPLEYIAAIADACGGRSWQEWTVEVNPDDITPEYASGLRSLGVNRVSMGVQSLNDGMLRWMGRRHNADGARRAFRLLREAGFENISVDIIFGVSGMDTAMLRCTLAELIAWTPEHISAYQLSIEEGSALGRLEREGRYSPLSDEECSDQYSLICRTLARAGYEHYEISNWALPGRRAVHNNAYWSRVPYVGLGPGAHSLRRQAAAENPIIPLHPQGTGGLPPETPCVANVCGREEGTDIPASLLLWGSAELRSWNSERLEGWTAESELLGPEEIREEEIMLGLRTADGIDANILPQRDSLSSLSARAALDALVPSAIPGRLRIPEDRWFTADDIISTLI